MNADEADAIVVDLEKQLGAAWADVITWLREHNSVEGIAENIRNGRVDDAINGLIEGANRFAAATHVAYTDAGERTASILDENLPHRLVSFDGSNERAVRWAQTNRLELRGAITQDQRAMIRSAITDGVRSGLNPLDTARNIYDSIGLTDYQEGIVAGYRRKLEQGDFASALAARLSDGRSDRSIRAAMEAGRSLTDVQVDAAVDRYRDNWTMFRAETISRTESLRVAHQGADELYQQVVDQGQVSGHDLEFEWVNGPRTGPDAPRPAHKFMHGQTRTLAELRAGNLFEDGDGNRLRYPGDPDAPIETTANCRCVRTTRVTS